MPCDHEAWFISQAIERGARYIVDTCGSQVVMKVEYTGMAWRRVCLIGKYREVSTHALCAVALTEEQSSAGDNASCEAEARVRHHDPMKISGLLESQLAGRFFLLGHNNTVR